MDDTNKIVISFAKTDLFVLDDYGLTKLSQEQRHEQIDNPTFADVILDRLVHNAHKIR